MSNQIPDPDGFGGLVEAMKAKATRDLVRASIIETLRRTDGLSEEIQALLIADSTATEEFEQLFTNRKGDPQ